MKTLYKILIVDDENILRNGLKYMCNWEEEGFKIIGEASNGKEALELLENESVDIVITDVVMPEINGIDLTKKIKKNYPKVKVLILSSFSEFTYIRETFKHGVYDYLLKTNVRPENILPILKSMAKEIGNIKHKNTSFSHVDDISKKVRELIIDQNINEEKVVQLKKYFTEDSIYIMRAKIHSLDDDNINLDELKKKIIDNVRESLDDYKVISVFIKKYIVIIVNFNNYKNCKAMSDINCMAKGLREKYETSSFSISNQLKDMKGFLDTYKEVLEISSKAFYFSDDLINKNDIHSKNFKEIDKFTFDKFNSHLIGLNLTKCKKYIKDYFLLVKENVYMDEYSLKRFSQNIIYNTLNSLDALGYDISEISSQKIRLFKCIDLANSYNDIVELVMEIFNDMERIVIRECDRRKDSIIVARVKEFIDSNYKRDISVASIAEELNINYNYLSHHFKNETNENLSAYINKIRVEKAKIYLSNINIPIADISEIVGFSEHNYLCKIFKKVTNYTPSEYRRMVTLK